MTEPATGYGVASEDRGPVRVLWLDRPARRNAFTAEGYRVLSARLDAAAADPGVAVCVVTGRGPGFCAGVDLDEMARPGGKEELGAAFDPLLERLTRFPKPLVAAVNGSAVGFGATILLHCDVVVVDDEAEIRMPFVALGTSAEAGSSWLLPGRVGPQRAAWMVLAGGPVGAEEAVASGLALVAAPAGTALEVALDRARRMAAHPLAALVANKALLRQGWAEHVAEVWGRERATMLALADELGSIGRPGSAGRG